MGQSLLIRTSLQSLQRLYGLTATRAMTLQQKVVADTKHADLLEDYASNCPAEIDGGPGLEESFRVGAEALRRVRWQEARADALRAEMCRLASWSQTPQPVANALIAAVEADNVRLDEM